MIHRRKPLQQKTPLQRKTELKRAGIQQDAAPVKRRKAALLPRHPGPQSAEERAGRKLLKARSGGWCEVAVPGVCTGVAAVWSHRKRRSQSGKAEKWCPTNGLGGCGSCELYLTAHATDAAVRANGWTVHSGLDPQSIPVLRRGVRVWLFPDGSYEPLDMTELAEWIGAA